MTITHTLKNDGAPFDDDGKLVNEDKSTKGEGRGVCACGEHSEALPSRAARRRWHDWHKENLPTEPTLDEELLGLTEGGELPEVIGTAEVEVKPKKAAKKAKAKKAAEDEDLLGDDTITKKVPWTKDLAGIFWGICGNAGSKKVLAAYHPEVTVKADSPNKRLLLTGEPAHVEAAVATVKEYWAHAATDFKAWKKNSPEYQNRDQTQAEDRRVGYQLTKTFFTDYANDYAAGKPLPA